MSALGSIARRAVHATFAAVALAAVGCTTLAPLAPPASGDAITGRLALRVDAIDREPARAVSAAFDLRGSASDGALSLSTPLGSTLGQARWQPGSVTLATPQGKRRYADVAEMTRDVLGESVPVEAWFDWLRGRPWPGAASRAEARGFAQLGWSVDVSALADGSVVATRTEPLPQVVARVRLDPN